MYDKALERLAQEGKKKEAVALEQAVKTYTAGHPKRTKDTQEIIAKNFVVKGLERLNQGQEPLFEAKMDVIYRALREIGAPEEPKETKPKNGKKEKKRESDEEKRGTGRISESVEEIQPLFEEFLIKGGSIYETYERGVFCATAVREARSATATAPALRTAILDLAGKMVREKLI